MHPPTQDTDPRPKNHWCGRRCTFDHGAKRLSGTIIKQTWLGYTDRGHIPDWEIVVQGNSGKTLTISLVESHTQIE